MKKSKLITQSVSLLVLLQPAVLAWDPPIGIPRPSFGIEETYRMYDDPANRNPELTYTQNAEGGYCTYYIDNTHPDAADTDNPYGTPEKPRLTIPYNGSDRHRYIVPVQPGDVYEIHGVHNMDIIRPDGWLDGYEFTGGGTETRPAFVRGGDPNNPAVFTKTQTDNYGTALSGSFIIMENIEFNKNMVGITATNSSMRNCEVHNISRIYGRAVSMSSVVDFVFYNNHVHHNWGTYPDGSHDMHNTAVTGDSHRVWVVDNYLHHASYMPDGTAAQTGGDAIQVMGPRNEPDRLTNVYIGRNHMHTDTENAVDIKASRHVVISQNIAHDYPNTAAMINHEAAADTWFIFNEIYNARVAIRPEEAINKAYVINNIIYDISYPITSGTIYGNFAGAIWGRIVPMCIIGNTIYNSTGGILIPQNSGTCYIYNNIVSLVPVPDGTVPWYHAGVESGGGASDRAEIDYNLFHQPAGVSGYAPDGIVKLKWGGGIYEGLADFISKTGKGISCIEQDPLFIDPENHDFSLPAGSPAIDSGAYNQIIQQVMDEYYSIFGVSIDVDFNGNPRSQGNGWDIGAYEASDIYAYIIADRFSGNAPLRIAFDGSHSGTLEGHSIVSYAWDFGDGASASDAQVNHEYTDPGIYTVRLTVEDNRNPAASHTASRRVTATIPDSDDPDDQDIRQTAEPVKTNMQCFNNVINPSKGDEAVIQVELDKQTAVKVVIYDHAGREIKTLLYEEKQPGFYSLTWDGTDASGKMVGSGIYMVHCTAGEYKATKKVAIVK